MFIDIEHADGLVEPVAHVEWDPTDGHVHGRFWRAGAEDPVAHLDWTTGQPAD